jgi:hypothetical protein
LVVVLPVILNVCEIVGAKYKVAVPVFAVLLTFAPDAPYFKVMVEFDVFILAITYVNDVDKLVNPVDEVQNIGEPTDKLVKLETVKFPFPSVAVHVVDILVPNSVLIDVAVCAPTGNIAPPKTELIVNVVDEGIVKI